MDEENQDVEVEETTEESSPEVNEATEEESTDTPTDESLNQSTEEAPTQDEPKPKEERRGSKASERIQQLIAERNELARKLAGNNQPEQPAYDGVDESSIDPDKFATSVVQKARQEARQEINYQNSLAQAASQFPMVAQSDLVGGRATALMAEGYTPFQAAEMATLEFQQTIETELSKSKIRSTADQRIRQNTGIPSAGRPAPSATFSDTEIANMSPAEYAKNRTAILKQNGIS